MKKIGLIDSGIGGLTLLQELMHQKIQAEYYYISDTHNVPYGEKPQSFLLDKMRLMSEKLIEKDIDAIVIACNTATATTIDDLRAQYNIPYIGMEPYINYLNHTSSKQSTALILTPATERSERFKNLRKTYDPNHDIDIIVLDKLALIIEKLINHSLTDLKNEIDQEILPLKNQGYEKLILGCTHYPIIKNYLESELSLKTIDPSFNITKHIQNQFKLGYSIDISLEFNANFDNSNIWKDYKLSDFEFLNHNNTDNT